MAEKKLAADLLKERKQTDVHSDLFRSRLGEQATAILQDRQKTFLHKAETPFNDI